MKQSVTISQNMGAELATTRIPNISFQTGRNRPNFNSQLIKKKEFKSINTVNSSGPDMSKATIQPPVILTNTPADWQFKLTPAQKQRADKNKAYAVHRQSMRTSTATHSPVE